jgi:predicted AAA+ superfamily ATPase
MPADRSETLFISETNSPGAFLFKLYNAWEGGRVWFDLDNPLDHLVFENIDYNSVYEDLRIGAGAGKGERFLVCIDEIQNFPEITRLIKYLIDHFGVKFVVTGSSNYYLRNLFPESLSGRKFLYVLPVLSFSEFLIFRDRLPETGMEVDLDEVINIKNKAVAGGKKVFFSDTGMLNLAGKVSSGQLLEVAVAGQLINHGQLSFYNKRNTSEIDFILDGRIAFEVKSKATAPDQVKLGKIAGKLGIERYYIISRTPVDLPGVVYPWLL